MTSPLVAIVAAGGGTASEEATYSTNGTSWTLGTGTTTFNNGANVTWTSIAYDPASGTLVAVCQGSVSSNPTAGAVMYSTDGGETWTGTGTNMLDQNWLGVCYSSALGLFVAVASNGTHRSATSSDGITWTIHTDAVADASAWADVCWSSDLGLFCAVGTNVIMYSSTGTSWTAGTPPGTSKNWTSICWAGGTIQKFVVVASSGGGSNDYMYSSNGSSWTQQNLTGTAYNWVCIRYSSDLGMIGVVGGNTGVWVYSTNGTSFTQVATGLGSNAFSALCWSHSLTLWIMANSSSIYYSSNGTSWSDVSAPSSANWAAAIALDPVALTGTWASTDGTDTFSGEGSLGGPPTGTWNSTEGTDALAAEGHPEYPSGTWVSTEVTDTLAFKGYAGSPPIVDTYVTGGAADSGGSGVTSGNVTLSTAVPGEIIVVQVTTGGYYHYGSPAESPTPISDTAGLTWHLRKSFTPTGDPDYGSDQMTCQIWWAIAPDALVSDVITVESATTGFIAITAIGIIGGVGFDGNADLAGCRR